MSNNEGNIFCCVGRGGGNDLNISLSGERIIVEYKEYSGQKNLFNYLVNQSPPLTLRSFLLRVQKKKTTSRWADANKQNKL